MIPPCWDFYLFKTKTEALWWGSRRGNVELPHPPPVHFSNLPFVLLWNWLFVLAPPLGSGKSVWFKWPSRSWGKGVRSFRWWICARLDLKTCVTWRSHKNEGQWRSPECWKVQEMSSRSLGLTDYTRILKGLQLISSQPAFGWNGCWHMSEIVTCKNFLHL